VYIDMLRLSENPPVRPPNLASVASLAGDWWVAHTKARFEKAFAWDLLEQNIPYLLPMVPKLTVWKGRRRQSLAPLFPSYVFFCGGADERYRALNTHRICQVIPVSHRQQFVDELTALEKALDAGAPLQFYPFAAVGKRCRVVRGPLKGLEGVVAQASGMTHLVLQVSILGQAASLRTSVNMLEAAD
jgi:transcription antitermination factor NusG